MILDEQINSILGIDEPFKAPTAMMNKLLNKDERIKMFDEYLECDTDLSFDRFQQYFENEQADRKNKKQDFTPESIATLINRLVETDDDNYFETAAGTGGILITHWNNRRLKESPFTYKPSEHWHSVEELSDRALPFLLFNMAIRGMNGVVFHGDALSRKCKNIYFLQNAHDDHMDYSDINVLPRSEFITNEFNVSEWVGDAIEHVETKLMIKQEVSV